MNRILNTNEILKDEKKKELKRSSRLLTDNEQTAHRWQLISQIESRKEIYAIRCVLFSICTEKSK